MILFNRSRCKIVLMVVFMFTIISCTKRSPGIWMNEDIPAGLHSDFKELNETLISGIKANKPKLVENIMSAAMLQNPNVKRTIELASIRLQQGKSQVFDEFYAVHQFKKPQVINARHHGAGSYRMNYMPTERETYFALFTLTSGTNSWMLTATYNKLNYGWKLEDLELNPYTIDGKTCPEWYALAQQKYHKGYLIDALNTLNLARSCSLPNVTWRYTQDDEMSALYSRVINQARAAYPFPVTVKQVASRPQIISVFNSETAEG
jgi:hypothetical protein